MGRIMAIDYGARRTGIAVTDPLQIIATGLCTIPSEELIKFLKEYIGKETVDEIVIGLPLNLDNTATHGTALASAAAEKIRNQFPSIPVTELDERFTSKMARQAMVEMELSRSKRRDKKIIDEVAATILLQGYMNSKNP
jgi:putative Holliday junction resolvase